MLCVTARFYEGVDQRPIGIIHPQPGSVFRADDEFVRARFRGQDRTAPADGELVGLELLGVRAGRAEIEADDGIQSFQDAVTVTETPRLEILPAQAALLIPTARRAKTADQVGDGIAVLAHGEACQLNPRRLVARLGLFGIEGLVDVGGDPLGIRADALAGVVFGHRLGDEAGELG